MGKKRLLLVGGGHTHALVLNHWIRQPLPNVALTLVSDVRETPYSGMLPGHVAGLYSYADSHIDLLPLAALAGAEFVQDRAIAIDPEKNLLFCEKNGTIAFDYLSLDIGSTPYLGDIQGAEYGIPAKPVPNFLRAWQELLEKIQQFKLEKLTLAIAGGGAGGVELVFNVQTRLQKLFPALVLDLQIWQRGGELLPNHNVWGRKRINNLLKQRKIQVLLHHTVTAIKPELVNYDNQFPLYQLQTGEGNCAFCHSVFLLTQASPAPWLATSGLAIDERGFVLVQPTLQSCSHSHIFAAGDIATVKEYPRPKAGVFAVRQGKPLFNNLQRVLTGQTLQPFIPQSRYLSLLGTGDKKAIALWGNWGSYGKPWWWLKDWIDRRFMAKFSDHRDQLP